MRLLVWCFLFAFSAWPSIAATYRLQAGDHFDFTRIVIHGSNGHDFELLEKADHFTLRAKGNNVDFDYSDVFKRIARNRISGISKLKEGGLVFAKSCSCEVVQFREVGGLLVLDILPSPDAVQKKETPAKAVLKLPFGRPENLSRLLSSYSQKEFEQRLVRAVNSQPIKAEMAEPITQKTALTNLPNIAVLDSTDMGAFSEPKRGPMTEMGIVCPSNVELDLITWNKEFEFKEGLAALTMNIVDSRDKLSKNGLLDLAEFYLFFALADEAKFTLHMVKDASDRSDKLHAITDIMRGNNAAFFAPYLTCDSHAALWAILSVADIPSETELDHEAIRYAVSALPAQVRREVGPILADRLMKFGAHPLAEYILRDVDRNKEDIVPPRVELSEASLEIAKGGGHEAVDTLGEITKSKAAEAPEALLRLVDLHIRAGERLEPTYVDLSAALAWEHRKTEQGPALARAAVLAASLAGDFETAIGRYNKLEEKGALDQTILGHLTDWADDVTFAKYALLPWYDKSGQNVHRVMKRLASLGFKSAAKSDEDKEPKNTIREDDPFFSKLALVADDSETKSAQIHLEHSQSIRAALDGFLSQTAAKQDQK